MVGACGMPRGSNKGQQSKWNVASHSRDLGGSWHCLSLGGCLPGHSAPHPAEHTALLRPRLPLCTPRGAGGKQLLPTTHHFSLMPWTMVQIPRGRGSHAERPGPTVPVPSPQETAASSSRPSPRRMAGRPCQRTDVKGLAVAPRLVTAVCLPGFPPHPLAAAG